MYGTFELNIPSSARTDLA